MTPPSITVVGGTYGEECSFPNRSAHRGSGARAAVILAGLKASVHFETAAGPDLAGRIQGTARKFQFSVNIAPKDDDYWFRYRYPLAPPTIYPPTSGPFVWPKSVSADNVLVFGMLEGQPVVHARRAVYDPQNGIYAEAFGANGSTADDLAVLASYSEGKAMTGYSEPEAIADALLADPATSVAIVKCGPQGALVKTATMVRWIRPFPTRNVYKIGSGDVFSAAFSHAWLVDSLDAEQAAWFASRMVAAYVERGDDYIDYLQLPNYRAEAADAAAKQSSTAPRAVPDTPIYIAAPFFTTQQLWQVEEVRGNLIDMGFSVFSPYHDVGIGPAETVAVQDLNGLDKCGLLLALLDGTDAGTLFEVGYAVARGIPVVAVAESVSETDMTMVIGSGCEVTADLTTGIYAACWHLMGDV